MAKNAFQRGMSLMECLIALCLLQAIIMASWPSMQHWMQQKIAYSVIQDLKDSIEWARWQAVIRHETIHMEMLADGWQIYSSSALLRQVKPYWGYRLHLDWHGFSSAKRFIFYPNIHQNHLNGVFQIGPYRLWVNRLGHMRESYGL